MASKVIIHLSAKLHAVDLISNPKPLKYKAGCELDSNQGSNQGYSKMFLYLLSNEIPL